MYLFNHDLFGAIAGVGREKKKEGDMQSSKKRKEAEKKGKVKSTDKKKGEKVLQGKKGIVNFSSCLWYTYCLEKKNKGNILATCEGAPSDSGKLLTLQIKSLVTLTNSCLVPKHRAVAKPLGVVQLLSPPKKH